MDGTQATTERAQGLSNLLRERERELLDAWEAESDLDERARPRVRAFLGECIRRVASALDGQTNANAEAGRELLDEVDTSSAARALVALRASIMRALERDGQPALREQRVAEEVLDQTLARLIDRLGARGDAATRHTRLITDASALLASSLDYRTTIAHVAEIVVPELCDWCTVDVVERDGALRDHVGIAHRDARKMQLMQEMRRRFGPTRDLLEAMHEGQPLLITDLRLESLTERAFGPEHVEMLARLDPRSVICVPLAAQDRVLGVLTLGQSDSGRRFDDRDVQLAEELARLASNAIVNAELHHRATEAIELRERVLSVVSHDLRSPLAAIDLAGAVLLELPATRGNTFVQKQLTLVRRNVGRMSRLIGDLLDMSSIQAGRLSLEREPCALVPLLAETLEAHQDAAREQTIALESDLRMGEHVLAPCDRDRVHQVLSNLLGNAIKFCEAGAEITLSAEVRGREARIAVVDTGPGIPEPELPHVFELFWKSPRHRGTGLGLFIARGIVEAHGGRMGVQSEEQRGSTFWFTLPLGEGPSNGSDAAES